MLELSGMGSVLRGIGFLYWLLAFSAVVLAIRYGKGARGKIIWATVAITAFGYLPGKAMIEQHQRDTYAKEAWVYFKKKCDTEAGEKIYKTYTGVKSVLVTKPLPPATAKDLRDQFWYGDPYSNATPHDRRAISAAVALLRNLTLFDVESRGLDFVEIQYNKEGNQIEHVSMDPNDPSITQSANVSTPVSKFSISWEDISTVDDRKFWVAASKLQVKEIATGTIVAERRGYFIESGFGSTAGGRHPWLTSRGPNTTCPPLRNGTFEDRLFILKALNPVEASKDGK